MKRAGQVFLSGLFLSSLIVGCSGAGKGAPAPAPAGTGGESGTGGAPVGPPPGPTATGGTVAGTGGAAAATGGSGPAAPDAGPGGGEMPPPITGGTPGTLAPPMGSGNPMSTGLDRHDALYCGEWQKTTKPGDTIYLIKGGKVVWSYSLNTSGGNEYGDCTMMSNGHVLFDLKNTGAQEIVPDMTTGKGGMIVWRYNEDAGTEVHSVQPVGLDKVLVMQNGTPAKLMLINKKTAAVCTSKDPCVEREWHPDSAGATHGMFRHVRMIGNGNLLVPYTGGGTGRVVEYQPEATGSNWKAVWQYDSGGSPWAAVRLPNGNTLISGNGGGWVREVDHAMPPKVVWELNKTDFPAPMFLSQMAQRLSNGNTIIANWCGPAAVGTWADQVQYFEVTPDKKFVWQLKEWANPNLGPGSCMQPLDEPGTPENPGEQIR